MKFHLNIICLKLRRDWWDNGQIQKFAAQWLMGHFCVQICQSVRLIPKKEIPYWSVVQYRICPGVTFGLLTILLRFWMNICPCWLDVMFQPRLSVCVTRIIFGLMINAGMLLASSKRLIFGWPVITLVNCEEFVCCQVRANETYLETKHQFSGRNRAVLKNV